MPKNARMLKKLFEMALITKWYGMWNRVVPFVHSESCRNVV